MTRHSDACGDSRCPPLLLDTRIVSAPRRSLGSRTLGGWRSDSALRSLCGCRVSACSASYDSTPQGARSRPLALRASWRRCRRRVGGQTHRRRSTSNVRWGRTPLSPEGSHWGVPHHSFAFGTTPELNNAPETSGAKRGQRLEMECAIEPHIALGSTRGMGRSRRMGQGQGLDLGFGDMGNDLEVLNRGGVSEKKPEPESEPEPGAALNSGPQIGPRCRTPRCLSSCNRGVSLRRAMDVDRRG